MTSEVESRSRRARLAIGSMAVVALAASAIVATGGAASAATYYCGSVWTGETMGPAVAKAPGCNDINLVQWSTGMGSPYNQDTYRGYYLSGSNWVASTTGNKYLYNGSGDVVVVSSLANGAYWYVHSVSYYDNITVDH